MAPLRNEPRVRLGLPVPGWTKETEWGPYFPLEKMPQIFNPASGFIQNCNDPPWFSTVDSGLNPLEPAPYFQMGKPEPIDKERSPSLRGERLLKLLSQKKSFTLEEIKELAFDTYVVPADVIVPLLVEAYSSRSNQFADSRMAHAIKVIEAWNRCSAEDSVAQTYVYFWGRAYEDLFSREQFARFMGRSRFEVSIGSSEEQDKALRALKEAIDRIQTHFGKTDVPWGEVNVVIRGGEVPDGRHRLVRCPAPRLRRGAGQWSDR